MTLHKFIKEMGQAEFSRKMKINPALAFNWYHHLSCPRPVDMYRIYWLSHGRVTYREMIEPFIKARQPKYFEQYEFNLEG